MPRMTGRQVQNLTHWSVLSGRRVEEAS